ncbi:HepT-like ribonuclease domain-containing protein [Marinoscillum pacificum]|uniref:HepT-like ribonuclease domain-containing protein n=1 Tax=Marinoscillum pacificum TaxID=392723 RepID=UPI0021588B35|nr:HepT-like ribonuclease domain-containing protein [Marinoscillum pacificum]
MDEYTLKWLYDIKQAITEIESYFDGKDMDFLQYRNNIMLKRAVERDLEIIGEALNRILKRDENYQDKISHARSIVGLRNHVIHAYDSVSDENIWSILIAHLPKLKNEIDSLIDKNGDF